MKSFKPITKKINLGIEILRFLLCIWIVIMHCSKIKKKHKKYFLKGFHVPTFFLIAFYFYNLILSQRIIPRIIARFQRLFIPYFLYPLIIFFVNNLLFELFSISRFNRILNLYDFYVQIIIGSKFHGVFWFQFNIILISLLFTIISFIFKENILKILSILGALSFYLHISKLNYIIFNQYYLSTKNSLGSLIEMAPLAVIGNFFGSINLLCYIKNLSVFFSLILSFIIFIIFKFEIFVYQQGFWYPNILLNICASTSLFLLFSSLCLENLKNTKLILIIKNVTKYTGGIYYLHVIYRDHLRKYSLFFRNRSYSSSFVIYILCYINCYFGNKLFKNSKLKYLFL